jgi:arabinofuranan 3-O-arabinosyltransferase
VIRAWRALTQRAEVLSLVLLAVIPALWSSPGRMPADTKLYLYLDPGRLIADARWSWDSRQFAGWVPHQTISYLWPSGPWFKAFDLLGVPDWVAHRLWLAALLASAGLGARWAARHLGVTGHAAWVVGAVYQLSPFVLAYVSRTSLMLAPYAALGWLVGLTVRSATRGGWRDAAVFALVVATVAAPNATATAMIAPAPLLWLILAAGSRELPWRRAAATTAKIGALSLAVSVWWIAMLWVQGRFGADVLGYSETLEDVSLTATSTEVLRGLGYWLFYVRDAFTYATTASIDYQASTRTIVTSLAVTGSGIAGLALTRWTHRRYAIGLVVVGMVLAVGVYPIDDPSPLMSPLADRSRSALALALRSSTRAVPLVVLGLALGTGALVTALGTWLQRRGRPEGTRWLATAVVMLAVVNLPALWRAELVDPALERDQHPPQAWYDAAALLDARPSGFRVLQLPGAEFGAFRWGYTVDPPLPGLTTRPIVTRDLLPLGSPAAMDVLYALDDRVQSGVVEPASVTAVARLLGSDVIWLSNDAAFDRFSTARPEPLAHLLTDARSGLGAVTDVGVAVVNRPVRASLDSEALARSEVGEARPPVQLVDVPNPVPILRAASQTIHVAGSGDGIVDAAAAGRLDHVSAIRYVASIPADRVAEELATTSRVIVTDTDRARAHHWRSSQDVWGFTEDAGPDGGILGQVSGDRRLPVFPDTAADHQTIAQQIGGARARASSYGPPFSYRPEVRPWRAVDGETSSAWLVADRGDPTGAVLRVETGEAVDHVVLVQPHDRTVGRWITGIDVVVDGSAPRFVPLDETSRTVEGQRVDFDIPGAVIDLVIRSTAQITPGWEHLDAVGFAEVRTGLPATAETVVIRSPALTDTPSTVPLELIMTRWRVNPYDAVRADPEPYVDRSFTLGSARTWHVDMTVRVARRATDATLATLWGWEGAVADRRLTGDIRSGGWAAFDGDPSTSWRTPFADAVGSRVTTPLAPLAATAGDLDTLTIVQPVDGRHRVITELDIVVDGGAPRRVTVPPPGADGVSVVDLAGALSNPSAREMALVVRATDTSTTVDSVTALAVPLPVGITEIIHPRLTPRLLPPTFTTPCRHDLVSLNGLPIPVQVRGSISDAVAGVPLEVTSCGGEPLMVTAGEHRVRSAAGAVTGLDIDRLVWADTAVGRPAAPRPDVEVLSAGRTERRVRVGACPDGCWLIHGEGFNRGWSAHGPTGDLGDPHLVDGGFNGWWLEPAQNAQEVLLQWTPQRIVDWGLLMSALAMASCLGLVVVDRRRRPHHFGDPTPAKWQPTAATRVISLGLFTVAAAVSIAPLWGLGVGVFVSAGVLLRRPWVSGVAAVALASGIGLAMVWQVRRDRPFPGPLWTAEFDHWHRPGLVVVALLVGSLLGTRPAR